jgi:hypothetical protein
LFVNLNILPVNKNRFTLKAPILELFDETLDINSTENYELSIQVSPEGFAFCLLDTIRNKYVFFRAFEPEENKFFTADTLDEMISKDDFLTKRYKKVNAVVPSQRFTLVPTPLFDPAKKEEYFYFNHPNEDNELILNNKITDPDAFVIYSASKPVISLINKYFPGVHPYHQLKPLFHHISHCRKSISGSYIHIHIDREFFNLIIFKENQLSFCNSFTYRNISDILYFVMNVFQNLGIKQEETIHFSGKTEKYDDLSSNFSIYVRNIKFSEPAGNFTFSYVFNEMDLHRFLNLFSIVNCEL